MQQSDTRPSIPVPRRWALALGIASCVGLAPLSWAGEHDATHGDAMHGGDKRSFTSADRDGDGRLSRDEYDQMSRNAGASAPPAGEGVPATEHQANVLAKFEDRDRDGDGYISADEFGSVDTGADAQ
jgi:hypothetical protein